VTDGRNVGTDRRIAASDNEPLTTTYSDGVLAEYIERYPYIDVRGELPFLYPDNDGLLSTTTPPVPFANPIWIPTFDLPSAAADLWAEKAGVLSADYDLNADGASLSRSQAYEQAMKQSRYWRSRRKASTVTLRPAPKPSDNPLWHMGEVEAE
jgi:hypothetical protein